MGLRVSPMAPTNSRITPVNVRPAKGFRDRSQGLGLVTARPENAAPLSAVAKAHAHFAAACERGDRWQWLGLRVLPLLQHESVDVRPAGIPSTNTWRLRKHFRSRNELQIAPYFLRVTHSRNLSSGDSGLKRSQSTVPALFLAI